MEASKGRTARQLLRGQSAQKSQATRALGGHTQLKHPLEGGVRWRSKRQVKQAGTDVACLHVAVAVLRKLTSPSLVQVGQSEKE